MLLILKWVAFFIGTFSFILFSNALKKTLDCLTNFGDARFSSKFPTFNAFNSLILKV